MRLAPIAVAALAVLPLASPAHAAEASGIAWRACTGELTGLDCATLRVPLNHAAPGGRQISLALSRVRHVPGGSYQGVLLVNPGGPGGTGRDYAASVAGSMPQYLRTAYDVIGFDPRGVGGSRPSLSCDADYQSTGRPSFEPKNRAAERRWLKRSRTYARACGRKYGALLRHMTTLDSARDMDLIRASLDAQKVNFFGGSWGSYLGAVYATAFPDRVRRMVLDSNVRPRGVWYANNLGQNVAFQKNLDVFFSWVARHRRVYRLGSGRKAVSKRFFSTRRVLDRRPAARTVGGNEFTELIQVGTYAVNWWPRLAGAWARWDRRRDASALVEIHRIIAKPDDNEYAVYNATGCTDAAWPASWTTWRRDAVRLNRRYPFATWQNTWFNAPCLYWPAPARRPVKISSDHPILLLQATGDAATPYPGGPETLRLMPRARLVAENGGRTHVIAQNGNACVDRIFYRYLLDGHLPKSRITRCGHLPAPKPSPSS